VRGIRRFLVALAVLLVGCTDDATPTVLVETTLPPRAERTLGFDGETVRLAVLADLSGPGASVDRERVAGVETLWAALNANGGFEGKYPVELVVVDHGGDPATAVAALGEMTDDIMAVAFASESVVDELVPVVDAAGLLMVPAVSAASWEAAGGVLTHGLPVEALVLSAVDALEGASWCVVADQSLLAARVTGVSSDVADALGTALPAVYGASAPDLAELLAAASCSHVLIEAVPSAAARAVGSVPAGRTAVLRSELAAGVTVPDGVEALVADDGTEWREGASTGMDELLDALETHTPDAEPDSRLRVGYRSQVELRMVLARGFADGDVRREYLLELSTTQGLVDMMGLAADVDRSASPPELPRQLRLFHVGGGEGGLRWVLFTSHRTPQVEALLATVVARS
jgi:hypothetical protein